MWLLPLYTLILFSPLIPSLDSLLQEVEVFGIGHTGHDTPERISNLQRVRFRGRVEQKSGEVFNVSRVSEWVLSATRKYAAALGTKSRRR